MPIGVKGKYVTKMPNKLERNVFDFVTLAGDYSRQQFQASFSSGGFCGGSRWAPRTSRWGKTVHAPGDERFGCLGEKY